MKILLINIDTINQQTRLIEADRCLESASEIKDSSVTTGGGDFDGEDR